MAGITPDLAGPDASATLWGVTLSPPGPSSPPAPRWLVLAARLVAAVGLAASVALLIDYLRPEPAFCDAAGGCATVRASPLAYPLGIPMPVFGVAFFAVALALTAIPSPRLQRLLPWHAAAGAAVAAALLIVQGAVIGTWCKLCVTTDTSALTFAALVVGGRARRLAWPAPSRRGAALVGALAAAAIGAPLAIGLLAPPPPAPQRSVARATVPEVIAREQRAGVVTVVDFIDFECPFCRRAHPKLEAALAAVGGPVRVVRKMSPLIQIHRHSLVAAVAWCCAEEQGKGDAMADALFKAPVEELTQPGCERIAQGVGLDMAKYNTCMASPETRKRVATDYQEAHLAGVTGLPTIYVGTEMLAAGDVTQEKIEAALRRALAAMPRG